MNSNYPVHDYCLFQYTPGNNPLENFFCYPFGSCRIAEQQRDDTDDLACTQLQSDLPAVLSSSNHGTVPPCVTTTGNRLKCTICTESFPRKQERNRHLLKHVPYFMHCPLPHCAWRGNRPGLFKKHWRQEDHRAYHKHYGHSPSGSQIETYNPWAILDQIVNGAISPREGEGQAIFLVRMKAFELQKLNMWMDPGGRNKRRSVRRA
ncbi:hypothetical protein EDB92DRAFT_1817726 [Lactarius akahatsu]|uniref:C2H2-type domain-containing protein n=1 Tax=Lactarius akahatsu TaxID=416441 RepID=A0AAD4LG00_9AGAM|nr:hypothetical protein EDB92DRAFT_1817726 [Lactarius akahatsu]